MKLREYIGISTDTQRRITWVLEIALVGLLFVGIDRGNVGIIVNVSVALLVVQLPPVFERNVGVAMDPGLVLWITLAVFLHALGTVGIPGSGISFYQSVGWWDHLTHMLSSSIVALIGYATARSFHLHSGGVRLPPRFLALFIILFVLAFGVLWEVIEFGVAGLASMTGSAKVLTQYGLDDTMLDLLFDAIGAVIVATGWGIHHSSAFEYLVSKWIDEGY